MKARSDNGIDRRIRQVAATYRKQGYHVTGSGTSDAIPSFLHGCKPDLVAEKDGDKVVIDVKRANTLRGTNDLAEIAERVAAMPGWRLEVVALRSEDETIAEPVADWLKTMLGRRAQDEEATQQCIYLATVLEYQLSIIASRQRVRWRQKSGQQLAAELAHQGVIDQTLLDRINAAFAWRNSLMHGMATQRPSLEQASEIETICLELLAQSMMEA